jgi:hypothetical protein
VRNPNLLEQRSFESGLNGDTKYSSFEKGEYINAQNFRFGDATEVGFALSLQAVPGMTLLGLFKNLLPVTGINYNHGVALDEPNKRIIGFVFNTLGNHGIYLWDLKSQTAFTLLVNADVIGGLNFQDLNYISSARVINGMLYWTDNFNEPRRFNINAAINLHAPGTIPNVTAYTSPMNEAVIAWIRRPPGLPPAWVKSYDQSTAQNNVQQEAFKFAWRLQYRDFEYSTLSPESTLSNINIPTDLSNLITVTIPFQEKIDQDVIQVDLVAQYMISGIFFIIRSWLTSVPADAAAIASHNAGTTALTYLFYNRQLGTALSSSYAVKPYDSVPLLAQTIEIAKNLNFMANFLAGYNTPNTSSLALSLINNVIGQVTGLWFFFRFQSQPLDSMGNPVGPPLIMSLYLLDISDLGPAQNLGYYVYSGVAPPPFPAHVPWASVAFNGAGLFDVMNFYFPGGNNRILQFTYMNATSIIDNAPGGPAGYAQKILKSDSPYQGTITFYDNAQRKCGVTQPITITVPDRTYKDIQNTIGLNWTLSNANAINEIPPWAYYYSIDLSLNQRTFFFLQGAATPKTALVNLSDALIYVGKNSSGAFTFTDHNYSTSTFGIGIDITCLTRFGMGYTFSAGDVVKLYLTLDGGITFNIYRLTIVSQFAQWIIATPPSIGNVGTLNGAQAVFEIYTPFEPSVNQPYNEVGQIFPVTSPGTAGRLYSVITGKIAGDTYIISRQDSGGTPYNVEAMNGNDKFYTKWFTDAGRPNFVDTIGQKLQQDSVAYSNTFVAGTKINGLSSFDALATADVPSENGPINKLQLTSKIEKLGTIMLAICSNETVSLYLGETVVVSPQGTAFLSASTSVIGTIYPLKGSFGTLNPESVAEYRGDVFWYDAYNGVVVQYSNNGLEPISKFKMKRFWRKWSIKYLSLSAAQIEALGSRPYVIGGIDPFNGEYLLSLPQIEAVNPNGFIPGFASNPPQNLFDIYDGQSKTMAYKIERNKWMPTLSFYAEGMVYVANQLYAFKAGAAYLCNDTTAVYNNFFGVNVVARIMFPANVHPNNVKIVNAISVEADTVPSYGFVYSGYPNVQVSDFDSTLLRNLEGVFYTSIYRDRNSPAYAPNYDQAWAYGDKIRDKIPIFELDFNYNTYFSLRYANVMYKFSEGQRVLANSEQQ